MPLFPANFVDDLKSHLDIVQIVGERVPLRKAGAASWEGLCPFHGEKSPSFHVHGDKQFFHCFGCGASGDVFNFVQRSDSLTFPDAVRQLAARAGIPVPEPEDGKADAESAREREALLKVHEVAAAQIGDERGCHQNHPELADELAGQDVKRAEGKPRKHDRIDHQAEKT